MRRALLPLAVALAGVALAGCVHEREKVVGYVPEGALAPPAPRDRAGTWSERAFGRRRGAGSGATVGEARDRRGEREIVPASRDGRASYGASDGGASSSRLVLASAPAPDVVAAPSGEGDGRDPAPPPAVVRSAAPPAHRPIPATTSLTDVAREKFLSATTVVSADRATLYVPASYAAEVSLSGASVAEEVPGRRTAAGNGVATLRRLTVRAGQVTVVVRDGNPDLQLTARGDVALRSDQPASVLDEQGMKSLLLKNDAYTPLR